MVENNGYIPKVIFDSEALELYMISFMVENLNEFRNINEYLGLVMYRLGFKIGDTIEFKDFNIDNREDYFLCRVNDVKDYQIKFENIGNRKLHSKITLVNYNVAITYECFPLNMSELGVRVVPVREELKYGDSVSYIREYSREDAKYIVKCDNHQIELEVLKPMDIELPMYDRNGLYARYRLDNEEKLVENLLGCLLNRNVKDIVSVYKEICEISLGIDVSRYKEIFLRYIDNGEITDIIHLKNGELEKFGMTLPEMGRTLFLNKDGSWNYKMNDRNMIFSYSIDVIDGKTIYNISIDDRMDNSLVSEIILSDSVDAKKNIEHVKKLIRKVFYKK